MMQSFSFKSARLDKSRQVIELHFPITDIKTLEGVSKLPEVRSIGGNWEVPASTTAIDQLKSLGFELSRSLANWSNAPPPIIHERIKIVEKNGLKLYPYQKEGIHFIENKEGRALIADEMGLGKTVQALSWLEAHPELRPVLVICPSSLKINWERETKKWLSHSNPEILNGITPKRIRGDIVIINYDILQYWTERLRAKRFKMMVADECHMLKTSSAKRTKAFKRLNKHIPKLIGLTGTPIENRPKELFNIISAINPTIFPNYYSYAYRFCGGKRNPFSGGVDANGASNLEEFHRILTNTVMIRRKKSEVLKFLPPKQIVNIPLTITNWDTYKEAENTFIRYLRSRYETIDEDTHEELKQFAKRQKIEVGEELSASEIEELKQLKISKASINQTLVQIEHLKQLAVEGKLQAVIEWMETFLESGEKLIVFAWHNKTIGKLMKKFPEAVKIDGSVSQKQRQIAVDRFQNDKDTKLMVANIKAGGVGVTLTAASNVVITEFPWSPSTVNQAIDRVHRITQLHQVTAWKLIAENTIEEKILTILDEKEKVISQALDGKKYEDKSVIMELIDSYRKIKK